MQFGLENYKKDYYTKTSDGNYWRPYAEKFINPADMGACLCYAIGFESYEEVRQLFNIPEIVEPAKGNLWLPENANFNDQVELIKKKQTRHPRHVLSVGSGRGELEAAFTCMGIPVVGCDPSPSVPELYKSTMKEWANCEDYVFHNKEFHEVAQLYSESPTFDTIVFCEAVEHIPAETFSIGWEILKEHLILFKGIAIICNTISNHPIRATCKWNHIRLVDDKLYDNLEKDASRTIFRRGSHLVLQF